MLYVITAADNLFSRNEDLVFSQSPKSREIAASKAAEMSSSQLPLVPATAPNQKRQQQSIVTLSSHSNTTTPSPYSSDSLNHVTTSDENVHKKLITSSTRHISQLAAQRRTKLDTQSIGLNYMDRTYASMQSSNISHTENALTESRLEEHDKRFGSPITMKQLLSEDIMSVSPTEVHNVNTGNSMLSKYAGQQSVYRGPGRKAAFLGPITGSTVRTHLKKQSRSQTQAVGTATRVSSHTLKLFCNTSLAKL